MQIINTVNTSELFHDLKAMGRENFSYEGAKALMEYLGKLSDDCDQKIDYNPVAFCRWYTEYRSLQEFNVAYNTYAPFDSIEEIEENTIVIRFNGGIIVEDF